MKAENMSMNTESPDNTRNPQKVKDHANIIRLFVEDPATFFRDYTTNEIFNMLSLALEKAITSEPFQVNDILKRDYVERVETYNPFQLTFNELASRIGVENVFNMLSVSKEGIYIRGAYVPKTMHELMRKATEGVAASGTNPTVSPHEPLVRQLDSGVSTNSIFDFIVSQTAPLYVFYDNVELEEAIEKALELKDSQYTTPLLELAKRCGTRVSIDLLNELYLTSCVGKNKELIENRLNQLKNKARAFERSRADSAGHNLDESNHGESKGIDDVVIPRSEYLLQCAVHAAKGDMDGEWPTLDESIAYIEKHSDQWHEHMINKNVTYEQMFTNESIQDIVEIMVTQGEPFTSDLGKELIRDVEAGKVDLTDDYAVLFAELSKRVGGATAGMLIGFGYENAAKGKPIISEHMWDVFERMEVTLLNRELWFALHKKQHNEGENLDVGYFQ